MIASLREFVRWRSHGENQSVHDLSNELQMPINVHNSRSEANSLFASLDPH